mgnify:CR=1 FL=1
MKFLLSFILLFCFNLAAKDEVDYEILFKPTEFKSINWYKVDDFTIFHNALGKADHQEKNSYYYIRNNIKYPLSIHKKDKSKKIEKIYYRILGSKKSFDQLKNYLNQNNFVQDENKSGEQYQSYVNIENKIRLNFLKSTQKLYSVEKWF